MVAADRETMTSSPISSASLSNANDAARSFSTSLLQLGFKPAQSQNFEWLFSYPDAAPFLDAIRTSFSPECVLQREEVEQLRGNASCKKFLQCADALAASLVLSKNVLKYQDVATQRSEELRKKKIRLALLKRQKEILIETLNQEREQQCTLLHEEDLFDANEVETSRLTINKLGDGLQYLNQAGESLHHGLEFLEREECCFAEIFSHAQHALQKRFISTERSAGDNVPLSTQELVKSYGEIKASAWAQQAQLAKVNAMLTALSLKGGAYLEMSSSAMPSLLRDLRKRGEMALDMNRKHVLNQALESIQGTLHTISLEEVLRQQTVILDTSRLCSKHFLEQRLRLLGFSCAATEQDCRYIDLLQALQEMASVSLATPRPVDMESQRIAAEGAKNQNCGPSNTELALSNTATDSTAILISAHGRKGVNQFEDQSFDAFSAKIIGSCSRFLSQVGLKDLLSRLESHPHFAVLIKETEAILNQNARILETVLRRQMTKQMTPTSSSSRTQKNLPKQPFG